MTVTERRSPAESSPSGSSIQPSTVDDFCGWNIPATHNARLLVARSECPFPVGTLSSLTPEERRALYDSLFLSHVRSKYWADAAFLIHPRGMWKSGDGTSQLEEDIRRHFPEWCAENFGITTENFDTNKGRRLRHALYREMQANTPPGMVVGRYEVGNLRVLIVASNMVPEFMRRVFIDVPFVPVNVRRVLQAPFLKDGRSRLLDAAIFAHEICGAHILGLGAMTSLVTHFGHDIFQCYQGASEKGKPLIVTGHRLTASVMADICCGALEKIGFRPNASFDDKKLSIGIIGAGSIGTAAAFELVNRGFGYAQFVIYDIREPKASALQLELHNKAVQAHVVPDIKPTDWKSSYSDSCDSHSSYPLRLADVVLAAPSSIDPYIWGQFFAPGVIVINDSQPPATTAHMMRSTSSNHPGGFLLEVYGKLPDNVRSTFDMGCPPGTTFTCAIETIVAALEYRLGQTQQNYPRPVEPEDIQSFYQIVRKHHFCSQVVFAQGGRLLQESFWGDVLHARSQRPS